MRQEAETFAVSLDEIDLTDLLFDFAVPQQPIPESDDDWRIEKRHRVRKTDGVTVTYWNFRARKSIKVDGKRVVPYRKGGNREQR